MFGSTRWIVLAKKEIVLRVSTNDQIMFQLEIPRVSSGLYTLNELSVTLFTLWSIMYTLHILNKRAKLCRQLKNRSTDYISFRLLVSTASLFRNIRCPNFRRCFSDGKIFIDFHLISLVTGFMWMSSKSIIRWLKSRLCLHSKIRRRPYAFVFGVYYY